MLIRFAVQNHRSIADPVELSMVAVDRDRPAARAFPGLNEQVLTAAGIYGANASGKTNVLLAMTWLADAVRDSLRAWDDRPPLEPFRFGPWPTGPTAFEVDLALGGVRFTYLLELDARQVLFEGLYSYPERRRRTLIEREGADIRFRRGLTGAAATRELLTPTTLALSAAMRFNEPEIRRFGRHLSRITMRSARHRDSYPRTERLFSEPDQPATTGIDDDLPDPREAALELLRFADLGIEDVRIRIGPEPARRRTVELIHRVQGQEVAFGLQEESDGTIAWFSVIGPVLEALDEGRIVLFDELDASLHPGLSARLIELFQDPTTNPLGAQLIFTAHDASLMNHLNRDEVWLTEKVDGATALKALAEFGGDKVRRSLNLERAYLQGRFGAVPDLDERRLHALRRRQAG